jgi:hypothetical protein
MDEANVILRLTKLFGSQTRLADAAGCAQSTMSEKQKTNCLTHTQMRRILATGSSWGVEVTPNDFFPEFNPASAKRAASAGRKRKTAA